MRFYKPWLRQNKKGTGLNVRRPFRIPVLCNNLIAVFLQVLQRKHIHGEFLAEFKRRDSHSGMGTLHVYHLAGIEMGDRNALKTFAHKTDLILHFPEPALAVIFISIKHLP